MPAMWIIVDSVNKMTMMSSHDTCHCTQRGLLLDARALPRVRVRGGAGGSPTVSARAIVSKPRAACSAQSVLNESESGRVFDSSIWGADTPLPQLEIVHAEQAVPRHRGSTDGEAGEMLGRTESRLRVLTG